MTTTQSLIPDTKFRALRELHQETHDVVAALNQTQSSLTRLSRLVEDSYQRKRKAIIDGIINGHDEMADDPRHTPLHIRAGYEPQPL